ncbi:MAG: glycosyltransferase family 4 protein [archaeon]
MKIALLSDSVYPFNKGGKETRSYELATNLAKRGYEVHFYTMKFWEGNNTIKNYNITFHGICNNYPLYTSKRRSIKQGLFFGISAFKILKEDFDVVDADHMVYFHLFPVKLACLIKRKPMIVTWHEVWGKDYWLEYMGRKGIIGYWIEKLAGKLPDKIISVSNNTTQQLIKKLKINKKKIITITNGIDFSKIKKIKPSKEKSDIIFAGRLLSHKNVNYLIKAVKIIKKKFPDIKCIIIGDGPERENLENIVKALKIKENITFKGAVEKNEDVLALIKSSKVFVLPSTREGFGISVIEALACGIPVVTIDAKENASRFLIKQGENGFLSSLDENDISRKIIQTLSASRNMSQDCLNLAKKYDLGKIISQFEEVYRG